MLSLLTAGVIAASALVPSSAPAEPDHWRATPESTLQALVGVQPKEEIEAIVQSGLPADGYVDAATGDVLAAVLRADRSLSNVGPGCTTSSLCMTTTANRPYGYIGSGWLGGTWAPVRSLQTGDRPGAFRWGGLDHTYAGGFGFTLSAPVTVTRIER